MTKPNITYFLGAGASCNKLPTIANMADKIKFTGEHIGSQRSAGVDPSILSTINNTLQNIANESRKYNTIDTYARKLFLNGNIEKLNYLKFGLSICFTYWQFYDGRGQDHIPETSVDHRYISLISSFLQKNKSGHLYIPDNIKFITWNYDSQIELALQYFTEYRTITEIQSQYSSIPCPIGVDNAPAIIHLNGIAGVFSSDNQLSNLSDQLVDHYSDLRYMVTYFVEYYRAYFNPSHNKHLEYFSYSWEENETTKNSLQKAIKILEETDIVVIIGYSFPVFNREVDRKLFENSRKFKVYYQDPKADKLAFSNIFNIQGAKIHEEKNCDQFFLPFEF